MASYSVFALSLKDKISLSVLPYFFCNDFINSMRSSIFKASLSSKDRLSVKSEAVSAISETSKLNSSNLEDNAEYLSSIFETLFISCTAEESKSEQPPSSDKMHLTEFNADIIFSVFCIIFCLAFNSSNSPSFNSAFSISLI